MQRDLQDARAKRHAASEDASISGSRSGAGGSSGTSRRSNTAFSWRSTLMGNASAAAVVDAHAEEVADSANVQHHKTEPSVGSVATQLPSSAGGSSASTLAGQGSSSSPAASSKRPWGAWGRNERILQSNSTLLGRAPNGSASSTSSELSDAGSSSAHGDIDPAPSSSTRSNISSNGSSNGSGSQPPPADGATIVSKRVGSNRPRRTPTDPQRRQDNVREALRVAAADLQQANVGSGGGTGGSGAALSDPDAVPSQLLAGGPGGAAHWWQKRFEALYMPTLGFPDGSVGFVQVDVSLAAGIKDVRVLTFEDRHDCMHCLAVMREWPETAGAELTMGAMPTATLEADIRAAWLEQHAAAIQRRWGDAAPVPGPEAPGPSPPSGVVVLRRGKLQLRTGMGQDEFMQLVVYQAAAQNALGRIGYGFDD